MPQVGRQNRQQALDVLSLAVPADQPMLGSGVPQVVQTRLTTGSLQKRDASSFAHDPEAAADRRLA